MLYNDDGLQATMQRNGQQERVCCSTDDGLQATMQRNAQ
jgi:hypothetical protein